MTTKNTDKIAPALISAIPKANGSAVKVNQNVTLKFNEFIKAGSGDIVISDGKDIHRISITDKTQVKISGKTVTLNPTDNLLPNSHYSVQIAASAITDLTGNKFAGILNPTTLSFNTVDNIKPQLDATTAKNLSAPMAVNQNIVLTFNETVKKGAGIIVLSNGSDTRKIAITDKSQITLDGKNVIINPTNDLQGDSHYNVTFRDTVIKDLAGNKFAGISDKTTLSFNTADNVAPTLTASSPADNGANVVVGANLVLTFNETIQAGSGNIVISNGTDTRTIPVTDKQITITNKTVTINPTADLLAGKNYSVQFAAGVITDSAGNKFAGITDATTLNFSTVAAAIITTPVTTPVTTPLVAVLTSGKAIDGYLSGSDVFADANGDGVWNEGEAKATTDKSGNFTLSDAKGTIHISGGTDLSTGKAFQGVMKAPEGSTVVTPFTTVQQGFIEAGQTPAQAEKSVATAFGFDADKVDLTKYDPIAELVKATASGTTDAVVTQMMASSAKIANFFVAAGQVLQGAAGGSENVSTQNVGDALLKSLVASIQNDAKTGDGKIELGDAKLLKTVIVDGAKEVNTQAEKVAKETGSTAAPKFDAAQFTDKIDKMADTVTAVLKTAADNITAAVSKGGDGLTLLSNMDKVSAFTQNDAGKSLSDVAKTLDTKNAANLDAALKGQADLLTGDKATKATEAKVVETKKVVNDVIAADKVISDKVISDKVISDKVISDKVISDKVITDKVITDKVITDKVITDKVTADAAQKVIDDAAAANSGGGGSTASTPNPTNTLISADGTDSATSGIDTFNVTAGTYAHTISGFATGDKLNFFANAILNVIPDSSDADTSQAITATDPATGSTATITLTNVTAAQDVGLFNVPSFATQFGANTLGTIAGTLTATAGVDTFNIAAGQNVSISGFANGDKLVFFPNAVLNVVPDTNQTDGNQTITANDPATGLITTITLTGITAAQDAGVFNVPSFVTQFGAGSIA